jgi:hypothetical protein
MQDRRVREMGEMEHLGTCLTLQGHYITPRALHHLRNHVVYESMLVPDLLSLKLLHIRRLINLLEDVLEAAIVLLQDGVLGAHVQWQRLAQCQLETRVCESLDGLIGVVLSLGHAASLLELENLDLLWLAAIRCEDHLERPIALNHQVLCTVLVSESVTADNDRFLPSWHKSGYSRDDNGFAEDCASQGISDGAVWG